MPHAKQVNSILNKHKKRDSWFLDDYSVNPYEGCSCNCQYCYIRGSKYGENMDERLAVKVNALAVLEKQLAARAKKGQYGFVAVGSGTDAYIHHEEKYRITEGILQLLLKYRFPVFISTKCLLVTRDIPLLKEEGFLAGVNAIPVLPFISDTEEELGKIISAARDHRADYVLVGGLTLFGQGIADSKTLFYKFLERYEPSLLPKYRELYGDNFYTSFTYQNKLKARADNICRQYAIRNRILE